MLVVLASVRTDHCLDAGCIGFSEDAGCIGFSEDAGCIGFSEDAGCIGFSEDAGCIGFSEDAGVGATVFPPVRTLVVLASVRTLALVRRSSHRMGSNFLRQR